MTLKLEVGKKYRNSQGEVIYICGKDDDATPKFRYMDLHEFSYAEDGKSAIGLQIYDLTEEVIEPAQETAQESVKKPIKWAKEAHAYIDGIAVEGSRAGETVWHKATDLLNPITRPDLNWRIAVPQWRKDLAEKMKAGGVLEQKLSTCEWEASSIPIEGILDTAFLMHEPSFRIKPDPKPDVVEVMYAFLDSKAEKGKRSRISNNHLRTIPNLKLIWDGEGNLKTAEVLA